MTRHWIAAVIDELGDMRFKLVCEHPNNCQDTDEYCRGTGCSIVSIFEDYDTDLLEWPANEPRLIGKIEVKAKLKDEELYLVKPSG